MKSGKRFDWILVYFVRLSYFEIKMLEQKLDRVEFKPHPSVLKAYFVSLVNIK